MLGTTTPAVHELRLIILDERKPTQGLTHGDYGLHKCLVADDRRAVAVLDWEAAPRSVILWPTSPTSSIPHQPVGKDWGRAEFLAGSYAR